MSDAVLEQLINEVTSLRREVEALKTADRAACKFLAYNAGADTDFLGDNTPVTIQNDNEVFDLGGDYNTGTYTFTAPVTGKYLLGAAVFIYGLVAGQTLLTVDIVTSNRTYRLFQGDPPHDAANQILVSGVTLADMDATDTAYLEANVGPAGQPKTADVYAGVQFVRFWGFRIA